MTPKKRLKFLVLALAGCFTVAAPALVEARDISLPKYSKDAQLAAFQTAAEIDPLSQFNDDDPLTEILSINEVDVWGRIRHGFAIPDLSNPLVQNHENYYLKKTGIFFENDKTRFQIPFPYRSGTGKTWYADGTGLVAVH